MKVGDDFYNHLFDGLAVLHRYHISNGKVSATIEFTVDVTVTIKSIQNLRSATVVEH